MYFQVRRYDACFINYKHCGLGRRCRNDGGNAVRCRQPCKIVLREIYIINIANYLSNICIYMCNILILILN